MGGDADGGGEEGNGAPAVALRARSGGSLTAGPALRHLLAGAVDYAGLFPPAALSMKDAVAEYARHRNAPDSWALGRFVVPMSRWEELETAVMGLRPADAWSVSTLAGPGDRQRLSALIANRDGILRVGSIEARAEAGEVERCAALARIGAELFIEPASRAVDIESFVRAAGSAGAAAKIRTGGVTADAFPEPAFVVAFLGACRRWRVRFKATAGLHHAVRGSYALTYEPSSAKGLMFGFLNVAFAAAMTWVGRSEDEIRGALEERSASAFTVGDQSVSWRGVTLSSGELDDARSGLFAGFGSCSFREPMAELGLEPVPSG